MNDEKLTDADLDRLEELLEGPLFDGEAMRLDEIQAMLCAVASGPREVAADDWLAEALGSNIPQGPEGDEAVALLVRLAAEIAAALAAGETVAPVLYPVEENSDEYDYATWADAYVFGAGLSGDWYEAAGKHAEDLSELLEPMFLLNGMLREDVEAAGERWFSPAEEARLVGETREGLPDIVQALYDFWRSKQETVTVRHDTPKVGRNDPCPCGSGKKFKQCCGHPDRLN